MSSGNRCPFGLRDGLNTRGLVKVLRIPDDWRAMTKALSVFLFMASLAPPQSGMREVVYEVDGTAKYANLTLTNKDGGKEQNQVKLPFELKFYAKVGQYLYLSAQKVRVVKPGLHVLDDQQDVVYDGIVGKVYVSIKCSGAVLQEASADAPYGIATAEGKLPD
jgi:hypothetical protein